MVTTGDGIRRDATLAGASLLLVLTAGLSFTRVFSTGEWRPSAVAAAVLATALAVGMRRLGVGALGSAITSVAGLAVFTYVVHLPSGPLIPGLDEMGVAVDLVRQGLVQVREVPAPTPPLDGLRILVTSGVWIVSLVAHELLVRASRPGGAILAAAAVWIVPLAVPLPPSATWPTALPFLAAAGLALTLEPDGDDTSHRREQGVPVVTSTALLVGVAALLFAGIAPGILPGYDRDAWVDLGASSNPRGYQPIVDVGDRLQLPVERDVLQVQTTAPTYLRLAALDTFDGSTWRLGPAGESSFRPEANQLFSTDGALPYEVPIEVGESISMDVTVLDLENIYVPLPYQVDRVDGPRGSRLFYSLTGGFVATASLEDNELSGETRVGVTEGFTYHVEAIVPAPTYAELTELGSFELPPTNPNVQLPAAYTEFGDLARQVYAEAGATTTIDRVLALQDFFIGDQSTFTYDTDVPQLRGDSALRDFVFGTQTGYCEYFSTSMAVMLRATGIPARVAVGFLPGRNIDASLADEDEPLAEGLSTYRVSTSDAHAWVEVLMGEYGWVRMDPTPRSDDATFVPTSGDLTPDLSLAQQRDAADNPLAGTPLDNTDGADSPNLDNPSESPTLADELSGANTPTTNNAGAGGGGRRVWPITLLIGLAGVGGVAAVTRRRRGAADPAAPVRDQVLASQRALLHRSAQLGIPRRRDETLDDVLARWHSEGRIDQAPASTMGQLGQAAAFGGDLPSGAEQVAAQTAGTLMVALEASVAPRDRAISPLRIPLARAQSVITPAVERVRQALGRDG